MIVLALSLAPLVAMAQGDKALAEALFQEGRELLESGETDEACLRFAESQKLDPSTGTLLNLALCHEKLGLTASAWAEFREALTQAERERHEQRIAFAKKHIAELEPRLSRVQINLPANAPSPLEVHIDGVVIAAAALGSALPLDPGTHRLEVSAPGKVTWSRKLELAEAATVEIYVPALEDLPPPPPSPPPPVPAPVVVVPQPVVAPVNTSYVSPLVWIGVALGGTGVIVGAITGGLALSQGQDVLDRCQDATCPLDVEADHTEAVTLANVANVSFAVGAAGIVLGVVGILLSDFDGSEVVSGLGADGLSFRF